MEIDYGLPRNNDERRAEYNYRVQERLGILCGGRQPTREQLRIAHSEARRACGHVGPALDHERDH
jgi:hypothetical protein